MLCDSAVKDENQKKNFCWIEVGILESAKKELIDIKAFFALFLFDDW